MSVGFRLVVPRFCAEVRTLHSALLKKQRKWLAAGRVVDEKNRQGGDYSWTMPYPDEPVGARRMNGYYAQLAKKYHRAAFQSWWPLEPAPLPPKP
jgi:hypothetical protein